MITLADRFLWDFWTIEHAGDTWLYALSAPRDPDPETRHDRARIDAFTSRDLVAWRHRGVALSPGEDAAWDGLSLWTGSVARSASGDFAMLYTGRGRRDDGRAQRIGLARSRDLLTWDKHPSPVLEVEPRWYRVADSRGVTHWRDPWLEYDATSGLWRAWITAQHADGRQATSGTIALAESADLLRWRHRGPVITERLTESLEVPQVIDYGNALLVNVYPHHVPAESPLEPACMSLLYRRGHDGTFGFHRVLERWPSDSRYVLKQVRPGVGLCWEGRQPDGSYLGRISDAFPFEPAAEGGAFGDSATSADPGTL